MRQIVRHTAIVSEDGTIALPPEIRRALGVGDGDAVIFETRGENVYLVGETSSEAFADLRGIWDDLGPTTIEEILEEQREIRGWDESARAHGH